MVLELLRIILIIVFLPLIIIDMVWEAQMEKFRKYQKQADNPVIDVLYWILYIPFAAFSLPMNFIVFRFLGLS